MPTLDDPFAGADDHMEQDRTINDLLYAMRGWAADAKLLGNIGFGDAIAAIERLMAQRDAAIARAEKAEAERDEARDWVRRMHAVNTTTCVWCGHEFPPGTPGAGAEVMLQHAQECTKHPLRAAIAERDAAIAAKARAEAEALLLSAARDAALRLVERFESIKARADKAEPPDDGLPPGPWVVANGNNVYDAKGGLISYLHPNSQNTHCAPVVAAYLARCGSPAVRRLLAAFEVTDGRVNANSVEVCRDHEGGVRIHSHREYPTICWLTPRNGGGA